MKRIFAQKKEKHFTPKKPKPKPKPKPKTVLKVIQANGGKFTNHE